MGINKKNNYLCQIGSIWRKWDLHVHTPISYQNEFSDWNIYIKKLKEKANEHDIEAAGINDYFSVDGYEKLLLECDEETRSISPRIGVNNGKYLYLFPVIELRLENFTSESESVNIHIVFSPDILPSTIRNSFLEKLVIRYQGKRLNCKEDDLIKIGYAEEQKGKFNVNLDVSSLSGHEKRRLIKKALKLVTLPIDIFEESAKKFQEILKDSGIKKDKYLIIIANKGEGGLCDLRWYDKFNNTSRAGNIRQNLLNLADVCFSNNEKDIQFLLGKEKNTPKDEILNRFRSIKPCVWGSDAHNEDNLFYPSNGKTRDYTWLKADLTFEGLKQILYEPEPGERVMIGVTEPDKKSEYQVIGKIKFSNTNDFPEEIIFNKNLCSIIGSRSSGKSALLNYIAHSIDRRLVESLVDGPGEGEEYHWDKIKIDYSVEWNNELSNEESPGKIVFIPQNYLFKKSKDSEEIKKKIEPVLFKYFPDFEIQYKQAINQIDNCNKQISDEVENWFRSSDSIVSLEEDIKNLGNEKVIKKEKQKNESKINALKKKYQLSEGEVRVYQEISTKISECEIQIKQIKKELSQIIHVSEENYYFSTLNWNLNPDIEDLPKKLQETIIKDLQDNKDKLLEKINQRVIKYKKSIEIEKEKFEKEISKIKEDNKALLEKYQKNIELEELVNELNKYKKIIKNIRDAEKEKINIQKKLEEYEQSIEAGIKNKLSTLVELKKYLNATDQNVIKDIRFCIEYELDQYDIEKVTKKINLRDKTDFVEKNELNIKLIREQPSKFLQAIYFEKQKINIGNVKKDVAKDVLSLTENILFVAEMEGDRIGGFSETTMTPGRRALFLLRLILAESEDKWPILVDQPEENLDSRSITNEIVPFLKKKKKERQIIMISHDANLVIGSDSEQVIVANRHGSDRPNEDGKQFNYLTGSIEQTKEKDKHCKDILKAQGIREHACDILDGGKEAFEQRWNKYNLTRI